ncbi:MAG: nuclear transport factor 2 family protein [Actinomycetota bacterium]|jgi:ketosteroid isomerase-like protein
MDEHPNVDLMRRGYAAFGAGDMATVGELFADDIVWHANSTGSLSGDYVGKDAVMGFFGALAGRATLQQDIHDIVANDEHVVVLVKGRAERSDGTTLSDDNIHVWHVRDGKATEFWGYSTDPDAANAFFA